MEELTEEDDAKNLMGMSIEEARDAYEGRLVIRCVRKNGNSMIGTCDLRGDRVNVETVDGIITKVRGRG